ncbi:glycosyltransferase family protein [Apilactobacillus quenuiae]|uniref:hypothetical protein n=1 Tax=Apilactobacillus quenuiae TaxID=2008377 RepID=UPI0012FFEFAE|nr:hypothetical protein [Apilactobacillus quenuiae]
MKLTLAKDEIFTLTLVHSSYLDIIRTDALDVHPPLYYIIIKFVFSCLLFYKHTLLSEIIVGRLFSILCALLSFIYIRMISKMLGIKIAWIYQLILMILLPNVLGLFNYNVHQPMDLQPIINIRMYSLAALFLVMGFYYLIIFHQSKQVSKLTFSVILFELSAYSHYFTAMMAGLFLLCYFVWSLYKHDYDNGMKYFLSGIIYLILYIPWILYGIRKQIVHASQGFWISRHFLLQNFLEIAFFAILFIIPFYWMLKDPKIKEKSSLVILFMVNFLTVLLSSLMSIYSTPMLLLRYMYPSLLIYELICFSYFFYSYEYRSNKVSYKLLLIVFFIFIPLLSLKSIHYEVFNRIPVSYSLYNQFSAIKQHKNKSVNINNKNINFFTENVMYAVSNNKKVKSKYKVFKRLPYSYNYVWKRVYLYMNSRIN